MPRETLVVKVGGREIAPGLGVRAFAQWAASVQHAGYGLVLVHGGGDEVTALARRLGIETQKVDGQRVTTPEVLRLVVQVLGGEVNNRLTAALRSAGLSPVGLTGVSGELLTATAAAGGSLGLVGEPAEISTALIEELLQAGHIPVLAPLALSDQGEVLNVNADLASAAIAAALGAELIMVTDVDGVLNPSGRVEEQLTESAARTLLSSGVAHDGMVPKLRAALAALSGGAASVWIGRLEDAAPDRRQRLAGSFVVADAPVASPSSPSAVPAEGR